MNEEVTSQPASRLQRWSRTAINAVLAVAYLGSVLLLCSRVWWGTVFAGMVNGPDGYGDRVETPMPSEWIRGIATEASLIVGLLAMGAALFTLTAVAAVIAAWRRSHLWVPVSALGAAMMLGTVAMLGTVTGSGFAQTVDRAFSAAELWEEGNDIEHMLLTVRELPENSEESQPPTSIGPSRTQLESEIRLLVALAALATEGPLTVSTQGSAHRQVFSPELPPFTAERCPSGSRGESGERLSLVFTLPSEDGGHAFARVLDAWTGAGFELLAGSREGFHADFSSDGIEFVSLHDRHTIDGTMIVHIESRCAEG